ncbi:MAG TPA: L-histidine N(alpha)-methyltransferase [Kofleriaceae bacterium]|nr:L-histidine N(alpha)-methyltransferase [Kofleriaceae bacterium]
MAREPRPPGEVTEVDGEVVAAVRAGLARPPRWLPPWLFYDARGSELFTAITRLPEYYPTRAERAIFTAAGDELMRRAAGGRPMTIFELGAGTADKTRILLGHWLPQPGGSPRVYVPVDVSADALAVASERIGRELPGITVRPFVGRNRDALAALRATTGRRVVLFIGSSIGNYEGAEAVALLRGLRDALAPGDALLLGTDLVKPAEVLVPAYDDAAGVTAAFNKNVLVRLNRELGADFRIDRFRHVALWNAARSRIEMHLESEVDQRVTIPAAGLAFTLAAGERIHTESSVKYDLPAIDALLGEAGFAREHTATDRDGLFAVHLARAT